MEESVTLHQLLSCRQLLFKSNYYSHI